MFRHWSNNSRALRAKVLPFLLWLMAWAGPLSAQEPRLLADRFHWKDAYMRFQSAGNLAGQRRFAEARAVLETAANELAPPYGKMAETHLNRLADAEQEFMSRPESMQDCDKLGRLCVELGAYGAAEPWLRKAVDARPEKNSAAYRALTYCLLAADRHAKADFQRPSIDDAYSPHVQLAALEFIARKLPTTENRKELANLYESSLECFSNLRDERGLWAWHEFLALRLSKDRAMLAEITIKAACYADTRGDRRQALPLYRFVRDKYPDSYYFLEAQFRIGHLLLQQGRFEPALAEHTRFQFALVNHKAADSHGQLMASNFLHDSLVEMAECHLRLRDYDKALERLVLARDKYHYKSWCGTCEDLAKEKVKRLILECFLHKEVAIEDDIE